MVGTHYCRIGDLTGYQKSGTTFRDMSLDVELSASILTTCDRPCGLSGGILPLDQCVFARYRAQLPDAQQLRPPIGRFFTKRRNDLSRS